MLDTTVDITQAKDNDSCWYVEIRIRIRIRITLLYIKVLKLQTLAVSYSLVISKPLS